MHQRLSVFGLGGEVFSEEFPMVAFTAPADADFAAIKALLVQRGRARMVALRSRRWHRRVVERLSSGEVSGLRDPPSIARMPGQVPVDGGVSGRCAVFVPQLLPDQSHGGDLAVVHRSVIVEDGID
ncbi:DUF4265 domain-containing protein [Streptomyces katrae]|uniref:DUF4265 domain-containing protein n=1 Tax=Streptomyces katrae TaxID=68223 RepID=UPI003AF1351D